MVGKPTEETTTNTARFLDLLFMLTDNAETKFIILSLNTGFVWLTSVNQGSQGMPMARAPQLCICGGIKCYLTHICIAQKHYVKIYLKQDKQMCDPLPPKQILLIVSVHVNEVLYRSQIFIEKSKTLNYFFNIYDTLVYCDLAAFILMSALVLVSLLAYYDTWSPFIVWGRMISPYRRSN